MVAFSNKSGSVQHQRQFTVKQIYALTRGRRHKEAPPSTSAPHLTTPCDGTTQVPQPLDITCYISCKYLYKFAGMLVADYSKNHPRCLSCLEGKSITHNFRACLPMTHITSSSCDHSETITNRSISKTCSTHIGCLTWPGLILPSFTMKLGICKKYQRTS
jgi:hypothetical protein